MKTSARIGKSNWIWPEKTMRWNKRLTVTIGVLMRTLAVRPRRFIPVLGRRFRDACALRGDNVSFLGGIYDRRGTQRRQQDDQSDERPSHRSGHILSTYRGKGSRQKKPQAVRTPAGHRRCQILLAEGVSRSACLGRCRSAEADTKIAATRRGSEQVMMRMTMPRPVPRTRSSIPFCLL